MPHALTKKPGDQFTPFVEILKSPSAENPVWQVTRGTFTVLTWRETAFRWVNEVPGAGNYLLGLVAQDLDGERIRQYTPVYADRVEKPLAGKIQCEPGF